MTDVISDLLVGGSLGGVMFLLSLTMAGMLTRDLIAAGLDPGASAALGMGGGLPFLIGSGWVWYDTFKHVRRGLR